MLILSLDSAGAGCSVCVWRDGETLSLKTEAMARGQDARLVPLVQEVLDQAHVSFANVDRVAVTRGPGSFTGLRIGLATARGFGLATEKPVVGLDRLAIYLAQWPEEKSLLVVLDSRRAEFFCQQRMNGEISAPALMTAEAIAAVVTKEPTIAIVGDAENLLREKMPAATRFLSSKEAEVVTAAALAERADLGNPAFAPRPLYLRAPDVTFCKSGAAR